MLGSAPCSGAAPSGRWRDARRGDGDGLGLLVFVDGQTALHGHFFGHVVEAGGAATTIVSVSGSGWREKERCGAPGCRGAGLGAVVRLVL